ncbi:MAG: hypothetical protein O6702_05690 [Candidatus Dadabacteria bacterium]|nr:hypothetical protein [Candidatus Dadabacteria bacterium]
MKYLSVFIFTFLIVLSTSCDETFNIVDPPTDPLINQEIAESQDYNLTTSLYGMQVAIDNGVDSGTQSILTLLDDRAIQFLDCQFVGGSQLGFEDVMLGGGTIVPPLSQLRVYVVPNSFECEAVGLSVCAGIYFFDNDIIVLSEGGFLGCGEFSVWRHELGHRYGMLADHSNQSDFESCIGQDNCELIDLLDIEIEGRN